MDGITNQFASSNCHLRKGITLIILLFSKRIAEVALFVKQRVQVVLAHPEEAKRDKATTKKETETFF